MTRKHLRDPKTNDCPACRGEPEPGYIEMLNNGPIAPCWLCNHAEWLAELEKDRRNRRGAA